MDDPSELFLWYSKFMMLGLILLAIFSFGPAWAVEDCPNLHGHYLGCVQTGEGRDLPSSEITIDQVKSSDGVEYVVGTAKNKRHATFGGARPVDNWIDFFGIAGFGVAVCKDGVLTLSQSGITQKVSRQGSRLSAVLEKSDGNGGVVRVGSYACEESSLKGSGRSTPAQDTRSGKAL